jgi:hypothetical protein
MRVTAIVLLFITGVNAIRLLLIFLGKKIKALPQF